VSESRSRRVDDRISARPASDDSVPLREHLEKLIEDLRRHFDAAMVAQARRFDDLRAADKTALDAAFASSDRAIQAAFESRAAAVRVALEANEKRLDGLNELRKDVAMSVEVRAVDAKADRVEKAFDKLEAKMEGRAGGLKDYIGWIVAAVTVAGAVIAMLSIR
jgi:hypothetical protein